MRLSERVVTRAYRTALKLYPPPYYQEYGEEMSAVFKETCHNAAPSSWSIWRIGLMEMLELPFNLIREYVAHLSKGRMANHIQSTPSFLPFLWRGLLGFGGAFGMVALIFCVIDSLFNSGNTLYQGITVWRRMYIHPYALSSGLGAAMLAIPMGGRYAWRSALVGILGYYVSLLLWGYAISIPFQSWLPKGVYDMASPSIMLIFTGFIIGGGLGYVQHGRKGWGWYAFAGAVGFLAGWLIDRSTAAFLLRLSPYGGFVSLVVIGDFWYFLYYLVPMILFGLSIGACLGLVTSTRRIKFQTIRSG